MTTVQQGAATPNKRRRSASILSYLRSIFVDDGTPYRTTAKITAADRDAALRFAGDEHWLVERYAGMLAEYREEIGRVGAQSIVDAVIGSNADLHHSPGMAYQACCMAATRARNVLSDGASS